MRVHSHTEHCYFFVLHSRLATLILAVVQLVIQIVALVCVFFLLCRPYTFSTTHQHQVDWLVHSFSMGRSDFLYLNRHELSTPQLNNNVQIDEWDQNDMYGDSFNRRVNPLSKRLLENYSHKYGIHKSHVTDRIWSLVIVLITLVFVFLLLIGCVRAKPGLMMPFFCFQIFDFLLACITTIGYCAHLGNMRTWINTAEAFPLKRHLMQMNPMLLSLMLMLVCNSLLVLKVYNISLVWSCYVFLQARCEGRALETGFCLFKPPYFSSRVGEMVALPCCNCLAWECHGDQIPLLDPSRNAEQVNETRPLLSPPLESTLDNYGLPKYEDLLSTPANANMPPPYYK